MSPIMELIRETEHPANSFSPDIIKYAFEAHNDLHRLVEWVRDSKHQVGCKSFNISYETIGPLVKKFVPECDCGLSEIQSLIGE